MSDSILHVSFTLLSITVIARHAAVCKFWGKTVLQPVNQGIVFEGFPTVIFGNLTMPAYDQMVHINTEEELDLVTDADSLVNLEDFRTQCPHPVLRP